MQLDLSSMFVNACITSSFIQTEWVPDYADTIIHAKTHEFELVSYAHGESKSSLSQVKTFAYFIPDLGYLMRLTQSKLHIYEPDLEHAKQVQKDWAMRRNGLVEA